MEQFLTRPWLKAYSGLSINLSAALFAVAFIGPNISFPTNPNEFIALFLYIGFAIMFLLITVWIEKELEK